jgi:hypothetical protein
MTDVLNGQIVPALSQWEEAALLVVVLRAAYNRPTIAQPNRISNTALSPLSRGLSNTSMQVSVGSRFAVLAY